MHFSWCNVKYRNLSFRLFGCHKQIYLACAAFAALGKNTRLKKLRSERKQTIFAHILCSSELQTTIKISIAYQNNVQRSEHRQLLSAANKTQIHRKAVIRLFSHRQQWPIYAGIFPLSVKEERAPTTFENNFFISAHESQRRSSLTHTQHFHLCIFIRPSPRLRCHYATLQMLQKYLHINSLSIQNDEVIITCGGGTNFLAKLSL